MGFALAFFTGFAASVVNAIESNDLDLQLDLILLPAVEFDGVSVRDALNSIEVASREYDPQVRGIVLASFWAV